jgi:hypothetical protein
MLRTLAAESISGGRPLTGSDFKSARIDFLIKSERVAKNRIAAVEVEPEVWLKEKFCGKLIELYVYL